MCVLEEHHDGITIGGRRQNNLRFADDTTLLCTSKEELLALLKKVKKASKSQNLLLNTQKTKIMVLDKSRERKEDFVLDGENIEEVESFVYLGSLINIKGSSAQEIRRRFAMGRGAVQNMVSIWKSRGMSLGLKVRFLRATAFPIAIYGCESWAMTSGDKKRVDAFELWCYQRLLRVSWVERKTNKWVLEKIGPVLMLRKSMAERKMRFFGHIVRKNGMEKRLMQGKVEGKRTALDISTGPLARRTFQTAGPVRASTFYLSLARTGHLDIRRATRFQIALARTMMNHSIYFSRGRLSHISAVVAQSFCYSETPAWRGASRIRACQPNTLTSVFRSRRTRLQCEHPGRIRALFSAKHMAWFRVNSFSFGWLFNEMRGDFWSVNRKY